MAVQTTATSATVRPDNDVTWSGSRLLQHYPRKLEGPNLVRVAKEHYNEELMAQANRYRGAKPYNGNNYTKFLTEQIDECAIINWQDPDTFREAFNRERATNLEARQGGVASTHPKRMRNCDVRMPAGIFNLSANPDLAELKRAREAYERDGGNCRYPSEFYVKLWRATDGRKVDGRLATALGMKNQKSAATLIWKARKDGPRLEPIVNGGAPNVTAAQPTPTAAVVPSVKKTSTSKKAATTTAATMTTATTTATATTTTASPPSPPLRRAPLQVFRSVRAAQHQVAFNLTQVADLPKVLEECCFHYWEAGETAASEAKFRKCCAHFTSEYSEVDISRYLAWAMTEWLEVCEDGMFLRYMTDTLKCIDYGMEMAREQNWGCE